MACTISSTDFKKLQRQHVGDGKDIISNLPDSILLYILSLLPTKDAVGTSILAKNWKCLWTNLSDFNFENDMPITSKKENQIQKSANCLLDLVDRLFYIASCIKRLRFALYHGITVDAGQVKSLMSAAVKHKVEELDLSLDLKYSFVLPHSFSASESLNKLCLELCCDLNIPSGIRFPSLKILNLSFVTFSNEKTVQQLFSGCPVLQELALYNCGWKNIKHISVTTSTLRTLTIDYNPCSRDDLLNSKVKIDAVNLLSFSCTSYLTVEFVLVNLTSIVDAHVDVCHFRPSMYHYAACRAIKLLSGLGDVKSLKLSNDTLECLSRAKDILHLLPSFRNLIHLDVLPGTTESTSEALMDILQKSPNLEVLDIPQGFHPDVCLDGEEWILSSVPCCFKSCLKLFCISSFDGGAAEIQLLKFLLKNAKFLGEIQIFCSKSLSADLKKQAEISDQLHCIGLASLIIKFL